MTTTRRAAALLPALVLLAALAAAQTPPLLAPAGGPEVDPVSVRLAWPADRAHPGQALALAVVLEIREGYHVLADAAQLRRIKGFTPFPTRVRLTEPAAGVIGASALYPPAKPFKAEFAAGEVMSFEGRAIVYLPLRVDAQLPPGLATLEVGIEYQACSESVCLMPVRLSLEARLPVSPQAVEATALNPELFAAYERMSSAPERRPVRFDLFGWSFAIEAGSGWGLALLLLAAAAGGFLLNLTPCVLPLIPVKVISLATAAGDRRRCLALGAATFSGVVGFWLALGAGVSAVAGFSATNQLFQYPAFTIGVGLVIAVMAAGMFGAFSVRLPGVVYALDPGQQTLHGAFLMGVLTAVLSTPCTAPFMGTAAAWAATREPATALATFAAIGGGMGAPYLALAAFPGLIRRIPRSGPGSELLKQAMALFMLAAAAYFIGAGASVLAADPAAPPSKAYWWPVAAFGALAGIWIALRTARLARSGAWRLAGVALGALVVTAAVSGGLRLTDPGPIAWVYYTPAKYEKALAEGKAAVVVFTAEWCLNCKALEQGVWSQRRLAELIETQAVAPFKVDLTGNNPPGMEMLRRSGSLTIPLLVVFAPDGAPVFQGDFYTADQVAAAIEEALAKKPFT